MAIVESQSQNEIDEFAARVSKLLLTVSGW